MGHFVDCPVVASPCGRHFRWAPRLGVRGSDGRALRLAGTGARHYVDDNPGVLDMADDSFPTPFRCERADALVVYADPAMSFVMERARPVDVDTR